MLSELLSHLEALGMLQGQYKPGGGHDGLALPWLWVSLGGACVASRALGG